MKTLCRISLRLGLVAACLAVVRFAGAQPVGASIPSAEWLTATSRVIVRGVIDDVERIEPLYRGVVTVRVLETLKGEDAEKLQFVCDINYGSAKLNELQENGQQVMLFLDDWVRKSYFSRQGGDYDYTRFPLVVKRLILLSPDDVEFAESDLPVYDRGLTPQRTPDMLTKTIRNYLKLRREGQLLQGQSVSLPPELRGGYFDVRLTYPADSLPTEKVIDFATFKDRFERERPAKRKPPYLRTAKGYIGVYALELMAADCDFVVRGVVEDWCFVSATTDPTGDTCGVRMRVTEALKGSSGKHVNFLVTDARDLDKLQSSGQELIVFLRNRALGMPEAVLGHQTRDTLWDDSVIVLDERQAEVLFADLTWQHGPVDILKRLRVVIERDHVGNMDVEMDRLLRQGHIGPPVFDFHPPASLVADSSIADNRYSKVYLPIDAQLETNAQRWAKSDNKDLRWLAARAMIYFKSYENAAILKTLLEDVASWERREMFGY